MFPTKADKELKKRQLTHTERFLNINSTNGVDFYSNDYLGIALQLGLYKPKQSHAGATGSRLISGNTFYIENVEKELAEFYDVETTLLFNSGYNANLALMSSVPQRGDFIFYDELIHASLRDGIRLSHAKSYSFKHNDIEDLQHKVAKVKGEVFVVVEGIYSMDGDTCNIEELISLSRKKRWYLIMDEAHSTGFLGSQQKGYYQDYLATDFFARVHTFGKALGTHGAVIAGSAKLKQYLINFARPFIYTTGMSNAQAEVILEAHFRLKKSKEKYCKLKANIAYFNKKIEENRLQAYFLKSNSPIQALLLQESKLRSISSDFELNSILAKPIYSPTVPKGKERIRIVLHSFNTEKQIDKLFDLINKNLK